MRDLLGVVSATELLRVLKPIKAVRPGPGRYTLPVLNWVKVEAAPEDGGLWLEATDLDIRLAMLASAEVEQGARPGFINPGRVMKLMKHWPGRDVTVDADEEDVGLTGPGIRTRLRTSISHDEWPQNEPEWEWEASVPWEPLRRMAGKTMWACSDNEHRPVLNGTYWAQKDGRTRVCGTNGHRLACVEHHDLGECDLPDFETIVPPGFWRTAFQVFGKEDEAVTLKLKEGEKSSDSFGNKLGGGFMALESPSAKLHCRLISGRYPNYLQVFNDQKKDHLRVSFSKSEMTEAMKRANAVASDQTHRVIMAVESDHLTLRVWAPDIGELVQVVPAEVTDLGLSGQFRVGVNAEYLLEAMRYTSGSTLDLGLYAPERAMELASDSDPGWQCLVMPLRLLDHIDGGLLAEPPLEELEEAEVATS